MAPRRKNRDNPIGKDCHWYRLPVGAPVHEPIVSHGLALQQLGEARHSKNRARERMYEGRTLNRYPGARSAIERGGFNYADLNAIKTVVDTFVSRLAKDRPMPAFDTSGALWSLKRRARRFQSFIVGKMKDTEFDTLSREALQDGSILGTGWTRIDAGDDDVYAERMLDNEVFFDRRECRYGAPRSAITVRRVARDHLIALYPKLKREIEAASPSRVRIDDAEEDDDSGFTENDLEDYVDVWEGIHLPTDDESEDGRWAQCVDTVTLCSDRWHEPRFPWAMFRLFKPRRGLRGHGFVDQLARLQQRVNAIVRDLQMNLAAFGRGYIASNAANDIPVEMLTGWQPFKLKYSGPHAPKVELPQPFNPAQLQALQFFLGQMFDLTGVSQSAATSKSALGPGASGVALDTQYDIDSDRFRMPQANLADYRYAAAQRYLDAAARVARRRKNAEGKRRAWVSVTQSWRRSDEIERLEYDDVKMEQEDYRLRMELVGPLPESRAGKLSIVEQLAKAGVIPMWLVPTLFDDPDLQQARRITLSAFQNAIRKMDLLCDETKPAPMPCEFNDLELELKLCTAYYNWVEYEGSPVTGEADPIVDQVLDRIDTYSQMVTAILKMKTARGAGAAPALPPGPEMAPPMPPMPGGVPMMPAGAVPEPTMIGAPEMPPPAA